MPCVFGWCGCLWVDSIWTHTMCLNCFWETEKIWIKAVAQEMPIIPEGSLLLWSHDIGKRVCCRYREEKCIVNGQCQKMQMKQWIFIGFVQIIMPLNQLTETQTTFHWTNKCQQAFEDFKKELSITPIVALPIQRGSLPWIQMQVKKPLEVFSHRWTIIEKRK